MAILNNDGTPHQLAGYNKLRAAQVTFGKYETHNCRWERTVLPDHHRTPVPEPEAPVVPHVEEPERAKHVITVLCLPALVRDVDDALYGQTYRKRAYGEKFSFEAVALDVGDLTLTLLTSADVAAGSVLYPQTNDKRWWEVAGVRETPEGTALHCVPSGFQPSFSG